MNAAPTTGSPSRRRPGLTEARQRLVSTYRDRYWQSIEELAGSPELQGGLWNEFAAGASEWPAEMDRRSFLTLMAASFALAGLSGCTRQPLEEIVPYVKQPEELTLGQPLFFASAMPLSGFGTGILVKTREGRPIKVDGNPQHPASLGGSSVWMQSCLLDLYDPDRARSVTLLGQPSSWSLFVRALHAAVEGQARKHGAGLRILTETVTSPTLGAQLETILKRFPEARWHQYDPVNRDQVMAGSQAAFGQYVATHYDFRRAKVIVSLDSDFLYTHPERLRYARQFTNMRRVAENGDRMNRLYVAESSPTITGAMADHRLPLPSHRIDRIARHLVSELGITVKPAGELTERERHWVAVAARELQANRGECLVLAGDFQPPVVHALEHALNKALGNIGRCVRYTAPAECAPVNQVRSLHELAEAMDRGQVELLVILGGNPVYNAPMDAEFGKSLQRINQTVHLVEAPNETSAVCRWTVPRAHFLESWSDIRSFDGTATIMQPVIAPLFDGRSDHELLGLLPALPTPPTSYELVRDYWRHQQLWPDFEQGWRRAVHDGVIEGTASPEREVNFQASSLRPAQAHAASAGLEVCFRPDPSIWDGRFANNPWLQETPKPISKLCWDNAVLISPALADREKLATGDLVDLRLGERSVKGPVLIMPGQAEETVTLHLGYGRKHGGRAARNVGFDFNTLRTSQSFWGAGGLLLARTGQSYRLVTTQMHHLLPHEDRQIYRATTLDEFRTNPRCIQERVAQPAREETLYNPGEFQSDRKWGMSIDLTTCIGCNACLMACNIENNIPVVGKQQVNLNREMLWLRIDTYFKGTLEDPKIHFQPLPCMHCENAPCEYVCPVEAAVHDTEGLNLQVYNRCVGTRYCSNNCPYKVRRFNFLHYAKLSPLQELRQNPEVTVRWRGVMEKCTYCVQRISAARIEAEKESRPIRDGEVRTACQEACPANAIVFGVMTDRNSTVAKYKAHPLDFSMLGQLNTRPRTTYLARLSNPSPELQPSEQPTPATRKTA